MDTLRLSDGRSYAREGRMDGLLPLYEHGHELAKRLRFCDSNLSIYRNDYNGSCRNDDGYAYVWYNVRHFGQMDPYGECHLENKMDMSMPMNMSMSMESSELVI